MNCSDRCAPVRRMGRSGSIAILALLALTVLPGTVSANYYRLWQGQAFAAGSGVGYAPPGYGDTENYSLTLFAPFTTPYSHDLTAVNSSSDGSGSAYVSGVIQAGVMDAQGMAYASTSINALQERVSYGSRGYATLTLKWLDDVSVDSVGKPESDGYVHLPWKLTLTDAISLDAPPNVDPDGFSASHNNASTSLVATSLDHTNYLLSVSLFDSEKLQRGEQTSSGVLFVKPGTTYEVYSTMSITVDADAYWNPGTVNALVDATHSAHFYLDPDPITGASYTTASGSTYFSPQLSVASEPASLTLSGIGISLAAAYHWRRRRTLATASLTVSTFTGLPSR